MNRIILLLASLIALCSGCKTTQTSIREDIEQTHVTVYDTTRVVTTVMVVDTAHTEFYHTSTTHTVEYYDKTTGQLRQRVIDQQSNIQMLQSQLLSMQMMLDSMRSIKADTIHIVTHEEEKEEVVEKRGWWKDLLNYLGGAIVGLIIGVVTLFFVRKL